MLPLQFIVDPGEDVCWTKDEHNAEFIRKVSLSDKKKLEVIEKYLDISYIKLGSKSDDKTEPPTVVKSFKHHLEKSVTLPSNFEFGTVKDELAKLDVAASEAAATTSPSSVKSDQSDSASEKDTLKNSGKSRAARHITLIGRRFGSLGRSFSKKIRRNLSSIARRGSSFRSKLSLAGERHLSQHGDSNAQISDAGAADSEELSTLLNANDTLIVAMFRTEKRHGYHEEMIRNYMNTARLRFLKTQREKKDASSSSSSSSSSTANGSDHYAAPCVNAGCKNYGTAATSYLCSSCLSEQREQQETLSKQNAINENCVQEKVPDVARKGENDALKNGANNKRSSVENFDEYDKSKCASDLIDTTDNSVCVTFN